MCVVVFFFFKQKTAYEMRISDWSSDVCSSDLAHARGKMRRPKTAGSNPWVSSRFWGLRAAEPARGVAALPHHFGDGRRDAIRLAAAARASAGDRKSVV